MVHKIRQINQDGYFETNKGNSLVDSSLNCSSVLPHGCCNGQCGSCAVQVVSGEYRYLNDYQPNGLLTSKQQEQGWIISCMAEAVSDLVVNVPRSERKAPPPVFFCGQVVKKTLLSKDVLKLTLKVVCDKPFSFLPGQYIDVLLEGEQKRAYSLSSLPSGDSIIELHIRHVEGGLFSEYAFNKLEEEALLQIEGPKGNFFWRSERSNPIIMIAGGTGFAPIRGMIEEVLNNDPHRTIHLYWGGSKPQDFYHEQEIEQWLSLASNMRYTPVLFAAMDNWPGRTGSVIEAVVTDYPDLSAFDVYIAGPPVMVRQGISVLPAFGLPKEQLYTDAFEYARNTKRKTGMITKLSNLFSRRKESAIV